MGKQIYIKKDSFNKDPSTVKFSFLENGQDQAGFIVFFKNKYYAYKNKCQHLEVELDWDNNEFFEDEDKFIVCATHGALYEPSTGKCIFGPCQGKYLEILNLKVLPDQLIITI
ncbi:MAG: Rieske (2Fe-2S) protein [Nitrosomonadales bacterium]|nr:Rieske (2Fe-2S) protein [Nitrosomonadales bacterium]|tara:strand:- start:23 stop:361 length:339 start_codon:yes stop_codon:yes gene_type:complete